MAANVPTSHLTVVKALTYQVGGEVVGEVRMCITATSAKTVSDIYRLSLETHPNSHCIAG